MLPWEEAVNDDGVTYWRAAVSKPAGPYHVSVFYLEEGSAAAGIPMWAWSGRVDGVRVVPSDTWGVRDTREAAMGEAEEWVARPLRVLSGSSGLVCENRLLRSIVRQLVGTGAIGIVDAAGRGLCPPPDEPVSVGVTLSEDEGELLDSFLFEPDLVAEEGVS